MKHITKQFLGYVGLLAVVAMTAVAYNLPSPAAAANSATDTITVTVVEPGTVTILKPADGSTMVRDNGDKRIEFSYSGIKKATFKISRVSKSQQELVQTEPFIPDDPESSGTAFFELVDDLEEGYYIIEVSVVNQLDTEHDCDSVRFYYVYSSGNIPVPETGTFTHGMLDNLNISQMDFVLTGLVVFLSVAAFSAYLVLRKRQ